MSGANQNRGGWLKDPKKPRPGETIGGGFWVFRRGDGTNRIRPSQWPFEYASEAEATKQAMALAEANPGLTFVVVEGVRGYVSLGQSGIALSPPVDLAGAAS